GGALLSCFRVFERAVIRVGALPVTGPDEEAADEIGAVFLVVGEAEDEQAVLAGSRVLFQRGRALDPAQTVPFWALHPWTTQRYLHLRCLLYGSNPTRPAALLEDGGLSAALAQECPEAWQRQQHRWHTLLASHLRPAEPTPDESPPVEALEVSSPEQALRAYYDAINHRQYASTWLM